MRPETPRGPGGSNAVPGRPQAPLDNGQAATLACLLEATARKPGNVHRGRDFADLRFVDLAVSAVAIGPAMAAAPRVGVAETVAAALAATRAVTATNTNLGMVLLIAPLAAAELPARQADGTLPPDYWTAPGEAIHAVDVRQTARVYEAIRLARPGGLGRVADQDVGATPTVPLVEAMRLAADRDTIAAEYASGLSGVLGRAAVGWQPWGDAASGQAPRLPTVWEEALCDEMLYWMARHPDSLIARKAGLHTACQAQARAADVADRRDRGDPTAPAALDDLDAWLIADRRRNPGTSADLTAASLFVALRTNTITWPL